MDITLPYNFIPRDYQLPVLEAFDEGYKRAVVVAHRRAGKDKTALNLMIKKMFERVGIYYYFLPTFTQARKIIWDGIDGDGFKFIKHFPDEIIVAKNNTEMKITVKGGSLFQLIGTDDVDRIVGTNPVGCVFSEYSLHNPIAWDFIRPILKENKGWALFIYTPRGHNHGYQLYKMAKDNPNWFCQILTVDDTKALTTEQIQEEIDEGMSEELVQQEFYCSFEGYMDGSYYHKQLKQARDDKRIGRFPWESDYVVNTYWDLGIGDAMAVIFLQQINQTVRIIDYYEATGIGMPEMAKVLQDKPYVYGCHYMPFDVKKRELGTGKMLIDTAKKLGIKPIKSIPKLSIEDGIDCVRAIFSKLYIDEVKCENLLNALESYHKEYDEIRREFKRTAYHDWSSHGADSLRYTAIAFKWIKDKQYSLQKDFRPKQELKRGKLGY